MSLNIFLKSPSTPLIPEKNYLSFNETTNETTYGSLTSLDKSGNINWHFLLFQYWRNEADSRTVHFPLIEDGPIPLVLIMSLYFIGVTLIGPYIMSKRPAYVLRGPMLAYNILLVALNAYFFYQFVSLCDYGRDFLKFAFPDKTDRSERTLQVIDNIYLYFLTKFVDLLDTIFFVLRKKNNQISGLHLYHHTMVPIIVWLAVKMGPTIPILRLFAIMNCFIHVVMYSYYALSAFGPNIQPYLWWKKYLTQIQLVQFVILGIYCVILGRYGSDYPAIWFWFGFIQNPVFFFLFYDFYRQSYKKKTIVDKKAQ